MNDAKLTRRDLYELVWSTPLSKLAVRFGVSDVALAKRCRKLSIPTPGLGYWARVAAGQKPPRRKLPKAPADTPDEVAFDRPRAGAADTPPEPPEVVVPESLVEPHPAVAWLEQAFKKAPTDEHDRLRVGLSFYPDACVRRRCVARTLLVLDALFKALESRGHSVSAERSESPHGPERELIVRAFGQSFTLHVEEKLRQKPHMPTKEELKDKAKYSSRQLRKWDHEPDEDLIIRLVRGGHYLYTGRTSWSDTKIRRLDAQLGRAVLDVELAAEFMRRYHEDQEKQQRIRLQEERKRLRGERLEWYRVRLGEDLSEMAAEWERAQQIRAFLDAYEAVMPRAQMPEVASRWLDAARRFADGVDPLSQPADIASELEPSDEILEHAIAEERAAEAQAGKP